MKPYPLKFTPELKERVWGGRALEQFGFSLPPGPIGEAWLIGDHPNGTTQVANGPLKGMGLDEVRERYGDQCFGTLGAAQEHGKFPLLIKLLDCQDDLSVQVHPNDHYERLPSGELGKTEMWVILAAKPGAKIIYGLQDGMDRERLSQLIEEGRIMEGMRQIEVKAGDSFYIPAGTVHALGSGVLVAEVQQNSDTVYRLYDYDRPGLDGKPRELHIEDSLNVIAYDNAGAARLTTAQETTNEWLTLVESPFFVVDKGEVDPQTAWSLSTSPETFTIQMVCEGEGVIQWQDETLQVKAGDCLLLPANLGTYSLLGEMTVIRSYLPKK